MDFLKNLPQVEEPPTKTDLEVINFLLEESKKLSNAINVKQTVIIVCVFVILILPITNSIIKNNITENNTVNIVIKTLLFCAVLVCVQVIIK